MIVGEQIEKCAKQTIPLRLPVIINPVIINGIHNGLSHNINGNGNQSYMVITL